MRAKLLGLGFVAALLAAPAFGGIDAPCVTVNQNVNGINTPSCNPVTAANPLPVSSPATPLVLFNRGGTILTGGASQTLLFNNPARKLVVIQNPCTATTQGVATAESLFIAIGTAAATSSFNNFIELAACASTSLVLAGQVYTGAVNATAATAGHVYYATEFQ